MTYDPASPTCESCSDGGAMPQPVGFIKDFRDRMERMRERETDGIEDLPLPSGTDPLAVQVGGDHYKSHKIQPIEFAHANQLPPCEWNIVKYACRHRQKGGAEDVRKIIHYAQILLKLEYGES